jgi:hypothetical protein
MNLREYFEQAKGVGVLGTADASGRVDLAVYARPHFLDDGTVAFIMSDRLSHRNVQANPSAAYLFVERGPGYKGQRLYLTRLKEETAPEQIDALRRKDRATRAHENSQKFLVVFRVDQVRPLTGD